MFRPSYGANGQQPPSCMDQCSVWLNNIPIITAIICTVNFLIYLFTAFYPSDDISMDYAICPSKTLSSDFVGIFTSPWFHGSFSHVFFNMMFLACNGALLEYQMGSLPFLGLNILLSICSNLFYVGISLALSYFNADFSILYTCAIGYSGILFGILAIDCTINKDYDRICCCFPIPPSIYPWLLLLALQTMMEGVSLLGHFSGLVMGYLFAYGLFNFLCLPSNWINKLEQSNLLSFLTRSNRFKTMPSTPFNTVEFSFTKNWPGILCCASNISFLSLFKKLCCSCCKRRNNSNRLTGYRLNDRNDDRNVRSNDDIEIVGDDYVRLQDDHDAIREQEAADLEKAIQASLVQDNMHQNNNKPLPSGLEKMLDNVELKTEQIVANNTAVNNDNEQNNDENILEINIDDMNDDENNENANYTVASWATEE